MNRHTIQKMIAAVMLAGILFQSTIVALAFSVPDALLGGQTGIQGVENASGVRLEDILAAAGLNNEKYRECTSSQVLGDLASTIRNFDDILKNALGDFLNDLFNVIKTKLVICALGAIPFVGHMFQCTLPVTSDVTAALIRTKDRELQQNFIARCVARVSLKETADLMTQLMLQEGPYGQGPSYVTNWEQLGGNAEKRARAKFWAVLVNTNICPYMKNKIYADFQVPQSYIQNPPPRTGSENSDGSNPFSLRAGCTLPDGFTPQNASANAVQYGGSLAILDLLNQPQNNPRDFEAMAQSELDSMIQNDVASTYAAAVAGGGVLPPSDCISRDPNGFCLAHGPDKQTGGTLRDENAAVFQAQLDFLTSTDGTQKKAIDDIRLHIANRLFDLANAPLPLHIELGPEDNANNGFTPTPAPTTSPGSGDPNDPLCTGGDPRCVCVKNDTTIQESITSYVRDAIARAMQTNSDLFVPGTNEIAPGVDPHTVLQAICDRMQPPQGQVCEPNPGSDDEIVIIGDALTISVDVITSDGHVRTNGGQAIAACEPGVQD